MREKLGRTKKGSVISLLTECQETLEPFAFKVFGIVLAPDELFEVSYLELRRLADLYIRLQSGVPRKNPKREEGRNV